MAPMFKTLQGNRRRYVVTTYFFLEEPLIYLNLQNSWKMAGKKRQHFGIQVRCMLWKKGNNLAFLCAFCDFNDVDCFPCAEFEHGLGFLVAFVWSWDKICSGTFFFVVPVTLYWTVVFVGVGDRNCIVLTCQFLTLNVEGETGRALLFYENSPIAFFWCCVFRFVGCFCCNDGK